jgi:ribonuclease VapC
MDSEVVLDTSAIVAIISGEFDAETLIARAERYASKLVGSPTVLEAHMVISKRKGLAREDLETFLTRIQAKIVPFDSNQANLAVTAFERFGRGNHPAGLNFGDCMTYALSKQSGTPLLFVGNDFSQTDVDIA